MKAEEQLDPRHPNQRGLLASSAFALFLVLLVLAVSLGSRGTIKWLRTM